MVGSTLGHYEILEKIGVGGMGEVYRARDTKLQREVAIKVLPQEMSDNAERRKRFQREATAIAALKHPNIVTIHSVEEADGHHFLTMELIEGKTLAQLLPPDGLPLEQFFRIAVPLAEAVNTAHNAGITHRDLKPANVMLDADGRVKVLDFGLAKLLEPTDDDVADARTLVDDSDTQEGRVLGTVAYMSPEQAEGKPVDARSDIFSLGIVLYEMATGQRPFKGDSSLSLLSSILKDTPTSVSELRGYLPVQLGRIVQHCLEKDPRKRFQSALDVANEIESLKLEVSSSTGSMETMLPPKKPLISKPVGIVGGLAVLVIVALILINPFKVRVVSNDAATAANNKLAIMYFENIAQPDDPERTGEIVSELLITGLSESEHLSVVSSQRLYDLLKQVGKEGEKNIDRDTATDIATRAGARWMMQGRILRSDPAYVITSQIVEVATGDVAASQRIEGKPGESIFSLVDRITQETLGDLGGSDRPASPTPISVANMSTTSEDAYRYYLEGIENERKFFYQEARESFKKALAIDSTFAMAAYRLAMTSGISDREQRQYQLLALRHADRASSKEHLYLESTSAFLHSDPSAFFQAMNKVLELYPDDKHALTRLQAVHLRTGNLEKSLEYTKRLLELDPTDKQAYNQLAYTYSRLGDFKKAIEALNKYIELAPGEPNPYDSRGDIYAENGNLDEAIASYKKAIEIKPDFADYGSAAKLGHMYLFKGDYENAAAQYRTLFASGDARVRGHGRTDLYKLAAYRGDIKRALEEIDAAVSVERLEGLDTDFAAGRARDRSYLLSCVKEKAAAVQAAKRAIELDPIENDFDRIGYAIAFSGLGAPELARPYLDEIESRLDSIDPLVQRFYFAGKAALESAEGNHAAAIKHFEEANPLGWWFIKALLGREYFLAGQYEQVVSVFEPMISNYTADRIGNPLTAVLMHYYLGVAYQEVGRSEDAGRALGEFLAIWKDADPRLDGPEDARRRLAILKQSG